MRSWWNLRRQWPGRTTGRGLTMRSEWKPKVLQRGATARYQCARRVRLRFIPRVEALSLARNRLLGYSRGVTPKTCERSDWMRPPAFNVSESLLGWVTSELLVCA